MWKKARPVAARKRRDEEDEEGGGKEFQMETGNATRGANAGHKTVFTGGVLKRTIVTSLFLIVCKISVCGNCTFCPRSQHFSLYRWFLGEGVCPRAWGIRPRRHASASKGEAGQPRQTELAASGRFRQEMERDRTKC